MLAQKRSMPIVRLDVYKSLYFFCKIEKLVIRVKEEIVISTFFFTLLYHGW